MPAPGKSWIVAVSRSHGDPRSEAFITGRPGAVRQELGSAVKFCRVAEGGAEPLRVGINLARDAVALVGFRVATDERAEEPVPDREDGSEVVLRRLWDVVPSVQAGGDEHSFGPAEIRAEVAVIRNGVDGGERDGDGTPQDQHREREPAEDVRRHARFFL